MNSAPQEQNGIVINSHLQSQLTMPTMRLWQLYVATYTLILGLPLLFFPNKIIPLLGFAPTEEPWVRLVGMFLLALSYLSIVIYREGNVPYQRVSIFIRAWFFVVLLTMALAAGYAWGLYLIAGIVLIGVIGSASAYCVEIRHLKEERREV